MNNLKFNLHKLVLALLLLFGTLLAEGQLRKLVFSPQWLPQAQFAGYYIALEKGFYREAGLDVELIHPSANLQATSMLASGKADLISLFLITAMAHKEKGLELINVGQISQHSAILFITKKSSGISSLGQLQGKKIGIWKSGFDEVPKALMAEKKIEVEWIPVLSTVNLFTMGGIDAMTVMSYNEYDQIINCGINEDELNVFPVADYGFDIPEDGLYCLTKTFASKKAEINSFLKATLKGWEYAANDKKYAIDLVTKQMQLAHLPANKVHQEWMLDKVLELIHPGNKGGEYGVLQETDFDKAVAVSAKLNGTKPRFSFGEFYYSPLK